MNVIIFTILPEFYERVLTLSIAGRAMRNGVWNLSVVDIKNYGLGGYKRVDDYSYGGGGMIMRADVLSDCLEDNIPNICNLSPSQKLISTSPRGALFKQCHAMNIASNIKDLYIVCNRFEGIDQRLVEYYKIEEISIGEYILSGGEVASCVIVETIVRLLPNALGCDKTILEESFSDSMGGMLEYDQYTKPEVWRDLSVPPVLVSGDHAKIRSWRLNNSFNKTMKIKE